MLHVTKKIKNWRKCAIQFASLTLDYQISLVMTAHEENLYEYNSLLLQVSNDYN